MILVLGKNQSHRAPNLDYSRDESPGWFDVSPKSTRDMMHERSHCPDEVANHQLPRAAAFWIMWIASVEECSSLTQNLMQIHCSTRSVILNQMTPQYTCSLSGVYLPHLLVLWSRHCSHMHIPVHSPRLPGYIDVKQTLLLILTTAGLFPDRPLYIQDKHSHVFSASSLEVFSS